MRRELRVRQSRAELRAEERVEEKERESGDLALAYVRHQHVGCLDVTMDDVLRVQVFQSQQRHLWSLRFVRSLVSEDRRSRREYRVQSTEYSGQRTKDGGQRTRGQED
jgi:hypothetical protein